MRVSDFRDYRAIVKKPIEVKFDSKLRAFAVPPPSSGFLTAFAVKLMSCKKDCSWFLEMNPGSFNALVDL